MSHFTVCAMIPADLTRKPEEFAEMLPDIINEKFEKFDINLKVQPAKRYLDEKEIERMSGHYKIEKTNLKALAEELEGWNGDKGGVDEKGLYEMDSKNPNGHMDYWGMTGIGDLNEILKEKIVEQAVLTPEGEWVGSQTWFYSVGESNQKEFDEWSQKFWGLLKKYTDQGCVIVLVDCHI